MIHFSSNSLGRLSKLLHVAFTSNGRKLSINRSKCRLFGKEFVPPKWQCLAWRGSQYSQRLHSTRPLPRWGWVLGKIDYWVGKLGWPPDLAQEPRPGLCSDPFYWLGLQDSWVSCRKAFPSPWVGVGVQVCLTPLHSIYQCLTAWLFEVTRSVQTRANPSPGRVNVTGAGSELTCRQNPTCTGEDPSREWGSLCHGDDVSVGLHALQSIFTEMISSNSHSHLAR